MSSDGDIAAPGGDRLDLPPGALPGTPASAGVVEGLARVVTDPSRDFVRAGEILVAPFTDPGWTALFVHAAGVVTEVGGMMTHGAVVAREYGIPAVVSVTSAVERIKTASASVSMERAGSYRSSRSLDEGDVGREGDQDVARSVAGRDEDAGAIGHPRRRSVPRWTADCSTPSTATSDRDRWRVWRRSRSTMGPCTAVLQ
jgi:phosphohistidine swiveling domain-containing protein